MVLSTQSIFLRYFLHIPNLNLALLINMNSLHWWRSSVTCGKAKALSLVLTFVTRFQIANLSFFVDPLTILSTISWDWIGTWTAPGLKSTTTVLTAFAKPRPLCKPSINGTRFNIAVLHFVCRPFAVLASVGWRWIWAGSCSFLNSWTAGFVASTEICPFWESSIYWTRFNITTLSFFYRSLALISIILRRGIGTTTYSFLYAVVSAGRAAFSRHFPLAETAMYGTFFNLALFFLLFQTAWLNLEASFPVIARRRIRAIPGSWMNAFSTLLWTLVPFGPFRKAPIACDRPCNKVKWNESHANESYHRCLPSNHGFENDMQIRKR